MHFLFRPLAVLLALASTTALARDLPAELVRTKDDYYLRGLPKVVVTQNIAGITEHKFDKDGILISQRTGGVGQEWPFQVELKKGQLAAIYFSASKRSNGPGVFPMQLDEKNRATILKESEFTSSYYQKPPPTTRVPSAFEGHIPSFVRTVKYETDRQVHDIYKDRQLLLRLAIDFTSNDGISRVSCLAGECTNAVEYEYGEFGPISRRSNYSDTTFSYENGVLIEEATLEKQSNKISRVYYGDYKFDECGNWIQRMTLDRPASDPAHQNVDSIARKIEYQKPCK